MKVFALSLVLLSVMLGGIVCNYLYINEVTDTMDELLDAMPTADAPDSTERAEAFIAYWDAHVDTVSLSVGFVIVDRVSEQAATLAACADCGDVYGYQTALALLRDAVGDVRRLEQFNIGNIL